MASIILKATKWLGHMAMCSMNAIGCTIFFTTHAGSAIGETIDCIWQSLLWIMGPYLVWFSWCCAIRLAMCGSLAYLTKAMEGM